MNIKKIFNYSILLILIVELIYGYYLSKAEKVVKYDYFTPKTSLHTETFNAKGSQENVKFDESYALNVTIMLYEKMYKKKYNKDDFIVKDIDFGSDCWNIYLKEPREDFFRNNKDIIYDGLNGLLIDKKCGAIVVNFGENYVK